MSTRKFEITISSVLPIIIALILCACSSCAQVQQAPGIAKDAVVQCLKDGAPGEIALLTQLMTTAFSSLVAHQEIDWAPLEALAIADGKTLGGCAYKRFVAALQSASLPKTTSMVAGPDIRADSNASLARVRSAFGGVTWEVAP